MSAHHHDDHHSNESKPVSFTVPFILACVTLVFVIAFLSLCDPKKGHHGKCECKEECSKECMEACEGGKEHHMNAEEPAAAEAKAEAPAAAETTGAPSEPQPAKTEATH